jgi:arabinose-5-phosphate isomerase
VVTEQSTARDVARAVLRAEAEAVMSLSVALDGDLCGPFEQAVELFARCCGKVFVTGLGKSGIVGKKIAATLTSTGTPAFFLHPLEALHGDLGLVGSDDVALVISRSGILGEVETLLPALRRRGATLVALTADAGSPLAREADIVLALGAVNDAGPLDTVPTASTTATLALGDALAVAVMTARGIRPHDLALVHPGGAVGRRLLLRVTDVMHTGDAMPVVRPHVTIRDALLEIIRKRLGMTVVVDESTCLLGVLTDGDLKRLLVRSADILSLPVAKAMTPSPQTIHADALVAHAVQRMEDNPAGPITSLVVTDESGRVQGVVHLHDCLRAGVR